MKNLCKRLYRKLFGYHIDLVSNSLAEKISDYFAGMSRIEARLNEIETINRNLLADTNYLKKVMIYGKDIRTLPKSTGIMSYIQKANLKALLKFNKIAKKNGLRYWIDFGTLMGAFRHESFIPWDDDIDISMMREDYEKLPSILSKAFKNTNYTFVQSEITRIFYKNIPVQLDIMPYDLYFKSMDSEKERADLSETIRIVNSDIRYNIELVALNKGAITNFSHKEILEMRDKYITLNKKTDVESKPALFRGLEAPMCHTTGTGEVLDYNVIFPLKSISFCNMKFPCPAKTETRLFLLYRDPNSWPTYFRDHDFSSRKIKDEASLTALKEFIADL